ncbi:ROK family protein, partial [Kineococcus sp. R8]|nr:ROK family protein [Kineococcus siccus]
MLDQVWDAVPVTGSDLMAATGLSRATVHDVCDELAQLGWVREVANQREHGDYRKGRPARRYGFDGRGRVVVGVDAGQHRIGARVTDLHGTALGHHEATTSPGASPRTRVTTIARAVRAALRDAGTAEALVLAVAVGVPAPVDADGLTPARGNPFWARMNPGLSGLLGAAHGWTVLVDNDANLAALAEGWRGHGRGVASYVTLLAGERFGAGVVQD